MSKNIVVFSDGTGQEGGVGNNTNVYKLFNIVQDRTQQQVSFYDRGLGTGWRKFTGSMFGAGISHNIKECYRFIFENYEAGDKIFLFGFSRGATTVRSLSTFIHHFGILPKSRPELIEQAYKIYKTKDTENLDKKAQAFIAKHHTIWTCIEFLGVWDTVAALGIPNKTINALLSSVTRFRHHFHDLELSESVRHARQALSLDERRRIFKPEIWCPLSKQRPRQDDTLKQVWFSGVHSDVGGSYKNAELSDIALIWLTNEAIRHGLRLHETSGRGLNPSPNGTIHDSFSGYSKFLPSQDRTWKIECGTPLIHESVKMRTHNTHNQIDHNYRSWICDFDPDIEPWPEEERKAPYFIESSN